VRLYNTLTRRLEDFSPAGDAVKIYVCGITPYDHSHLGHAMSYIIFDVLRRYLEYRGYQVRHVQNYTDIDDRIIARASALGVPYQHLADTYIAEYAEEMQELNVLPAHIYPRATKEIPHIIQIIAGLIEKGYAYQANGDVYFRVQKLPDYGKLSGRGLDGLLAGARVEPSGSKEHPADFALWKTAKPDEPAWDSPFGPGRPGWHIECSAMSLRYLGQTMDIHGGGQDLIFPHHENEIAQSEAYSGVQPFARFWVHHGWLTLDEEKMSKSLGNIITISQGLDRFGADALRLFVLTSHYRSPLTYSEEGLAAAQRGAQRLRLAVTMMEGSATPAVDSDPFRQRFLAAMDEDLNTAGALAVLFDLAREINRGRDEGRRCEAAQAALRDLAGVLGLTLQEPKIALAAQPFIELLMEVRDQLRTHKLYDLADAIRSRLDELGVALEDGPEGTRWRRRG
jgi:cysteinyl-tRNA synthetase